MKPRSQSANASVQRPTRRFGRLAAAVLAAISIAGCSAQPMTVEQELTTAGIAGAIGAGGGAIFAAAGGASIFLSGNGKAYPASIGIFAAGAAGVVLLYEEVKREAALENMPPVPTQPGTATAPPPSLNP